jgi:hypothetical protein
MSDEMEDHSSEIPAIEAPRLEKPVRLFDATTLAGLHRIVLELDKARKSLGEPEDFR